MDPTTEEIFERVFATLSPALQAVVAFDVMALAKDASNLQSAITSANFGAIQNALDSLVGHVSGLVTSISEFEKSGAAQFGTLSPIEMHALAYTMFPNDCNNAGVVWFDVAPGMPMYHNGAFVGNAVDLMGTLNVDPGLLYGSGG